MDRATLPLNWNVPIAELELKDNEPQAYIRLPLARRVDSDIAAGLAYFPSIKRSRGKPPTRTSMLGFIRQNRDLHGTHAEDWPGLPPLRENHYMSMLRNGVSSPGRVSPTVLSSGLVRYERFGDLRISLETAETHLAGRLTNEFDDRRRCSLLLPT